MRRDSYRLIAMAGLALLALGTAAAWAQKPSLDTVQRIVDQGKGWYLLEFPGVNPATGAAPLVWLVSAEGVDTVPVTSFQRDFIETEFSEDSGGDSLDDEGPGWIALDQVALDAVESGIFPPGYEPYAEPNEGLGCPDHIKTKTVPFSGNIDSESETFDLGGDFEGTLSATLPGQIDAELQFTYKELNHGPFEPLCLTIGFSYRTARIVGTASFDGAAALEAAVTYQGHWEESWPLINILLAHVSFTIGPVPVWIDFNFRLDVGIELDIEVTANVTTEATIHAEGSFDYTCTRSSCSGTNTFDSDDFQFGEVNAGLEARLKAQAWAEPMLGAEVWKNPLLDILKGEVGLRGLVEADIWGYFGSTCGDADGDGTNETVKALAADLQWGYDVRYNYEILEHRVERTEPGPRYLLGWWDVLDRLGQGKSTALQPMVLGPAEVPTATGQNYTFRMRPCYPYSEHVNFEVNGNWTGVKTIAEPQSTDPALNSSILSRVFNQPGPHQITAVTVIDGKGREILVPYTREVLAIAPPPPPPPPPAEIRVRVAGGSQVPDGGAYTFPRTHVSNLPVDKTFEIWNDGGVDLTLQNPGALVSGDGFTQVGSAASVVPPGGHTTFKVRFSAASPWIYSGAVTILNNDADEGVYDVALSGRSLGTCVADPSTLCLQGGRFKVRVDYDGGAGKAVPHTDLGGFFGFANTTNLEVGVKVLQPPSGNWWVFHGPATHLEYTVTMYDTVTGNDKTYTKPQGSFCGDPGILPGGGSSALGGAAPMPAKSGSAGSCDPSGSAVCLNDDRFRVEVLRNGSPQPADELTPLTGVFSFANPDNPEVFVKVLGPVGAGGDYWVFYGALTDQSYTVRVTDTAVSPNEVVTYSNPQGTYCGGADTNAF